jgi:PhzF family phenazine biosynthesis protein
MTDTARLYRLAAFSDDPAGGNPAGVWIGRHLPEGQVMQQIAAAVGYSETAFVAPAEGFDRRIRYYSPLAEVSFCGHATIATGVLLGRTDGPGAYRLDSAVGDIALDVSCPGDTITATLTSVPTRFEPANEVMLLAILETLNWDRQELDSRIPPAVAYAGARHLVLAARTKERLDRLAYPFEALKTLMQEYGLTTLQLIWRESDSVIHSRNPFPVGGVVEDAATGAAAAALGGYLRDAGILKAPFEFLVRQGEAMGRPSRLYVSVPKKGGVAVTGTAVEIADDETVGAAVSRDLDQA